MKKNLLPVTLLFIALVFNTLSCSKSDHQPADPEGTVALNMLDEDHGKTWLGTSDVYIETGNNFSGNYFVISQVGKKRKLENSAPHLKGLSHKIAVEPGYAYQVFLKRDLVEFPSGKIAIGVDADYYNLYVSAPFVQDNEKLGYSVKYVGTHAPDYGMPQMGNMIGTLNRYDYQDQEIIIELTTDNFEYYWEEGYNRMNIQRRGKNLVIRLDEFVRTETFDLYIRINESYTYLWGKVE